MKIALRPFQLNSGQSFDRFVVESYRALVSQPVADKLEAALRAVMLTTRLTLLGKSGNMIVIHVMTQALLSFIRGLNLAADEDMSQELDFVLKAQIWSFLDENAIGGATELALEDWSRLDIEQPNNVQV